MSATDHPINPKTIKSDVTAPGFGSRLRFFWALCVAGLCFIFIGIPAIVIGYLLRWLFGIEGFIFPFAKCGCRLYMRAAGARVHVSGLENLTPGRTYLFIANHQSTLDPPLLFAYLGWNVGALAKKELSRVPILGQGMSLGHVIPIDRANRERAIASANLGARALRAGHSLMAFPEGTRTVDGRVREFKKGVFLMALDAGVEIVPVVVNDTRLVMRKGVRASIPGDVWVEVLSPVATAAYTRENVEELITRVRELIVPRVRHD
jgi:1-acyl-sn-glycerol-3-phosphate acyltransferase